MTSTLPIPSTIVSKPDHATHKSNESDTASAAGSDVSSLTEKNEFDYTQPFLRHPELLGVAHEKGLDAASFPGLAPGAAFFGQFLNGGVLQHCLSNPSLCIPDTLARLHVGGRFRWVWIEDGAKSAQEIMYTDRPLAVRREHIIARLCGGWINEESRWTSEAALPEDSPRPLAVMKRSTGLTSADSHVLFHREDVCLLERNIFE